MLPQAALLATCLAYGASGLPAPRGNTVLDVAEKKRVFGVSVIGRFGVLIGAGDVLFDRRPPLGFGFGLALRYHALRLGPMRFGFEFQGGHTRFPDRNRFTVPADPSTPIDPNTGAPVEQQVTRVSSLSHTDLTLGPSFQIPARVLVIEFGAGAGLMISNWRRMRSANPWEDEQTVAYDPLIRVGASIGVPIRNNHGLALGVDWQKAFSRTRVVTDPAAPIGAKPDSVVFDMLLNVTLAYQAWF
jgi:hypothetical protein